MTEPVPLYFPLADQFLLLDWGGGIDANTNARVLAAFRQLRAAALPGVLDLVPAYSSLGVAYDAVQLLKRFPGRQPFEVLREQIEKILEKPAQDGGDPGRLLEIPVCYDPDLGPDLEALAVRSGLSTEEIVQRHSEQEYRVYMLGFLPGFAYMGAVDAAIATPRQEQPRPFVPAGSVGIAGQQTGIYPLDSPGGWNLIGRTPLRMFDPARAEPALLRPGDRVRFIPISRALFHQMQIPA